MRYDLYSNDTILLVFSKLEWVFEFLDRRENSIGKEFILVDNDERIVYNILKVSDKVTKMTYRGLLQKEKQNV